MQTVEKNILIDAPPEEVFAYLDAPQHLPEIWPSMVEISKVEDIPAGGHRFHWLYKMAGVRLEGDTETVEYERNKHVVTKSTGQVPNTLDWEFIPEGDSTRFKMKMEYEVPTSLLGKLTEPFVLKLNEREADVFVGNLKDRFEA